MPRKGFLKLDDQPTPWIKASTGIAKKSISNKKHQERASGCKRSLDLMPCLVTGQTSLKSQLT
ncbi:MAG: hypothetical protein B7Z37_18155 [Verrucomicrobia bacterium 12-59-8]|nr:MAG: hypothetical protein B7Z37_18155 [Verrucomicrobia bacterium 12-59-8]